MTPRPAAIALLAASLGFAASAEAELKGDAAKASRARSFTIELSLPEAEKELEKANAGDQLLQVERAWLDVYSGRCSEASEILSRPELSESEDSKRLGEIARGCAQTMAGAVVREDVASGAWIRFQDDADVVLAPYLFKVVASTREVFQKDLGVTMPTPMRVELVRDQIGLAAMTGLPMEAARTTGTIGIAKWGRVIMVSPRATDHGYAFLDTLAHELTHLALTRASKDRAPLWLQEGVARSEETRWRTPLPFDEAPGADEVAAYGQKRGMGPEIDKIGPSIALLPSAEEAQVTYAKVQSFMKFYAAKAGEEALPKLLAGLATASNPEDIDGTIKSLTGSTFGEWSARWKSEVLASAKELPADERPGRPPPKDLKKAQKRYRLGELLLDRSHAAAAERELEQAHASLPKGGSIRALYARAQVKTDKRDKAKRLVENASDVSTGDAGWWSMRALLAVGEVEAAIENAIAIAPYDPNVACEEKAPPALPSDAARRALCEAARAKPRDP